MSAARSKNPRRPSAPLTLLPETICRYDGPLWRIHTTTGRHPQEWNDLRWNGPIHNQRWDPQRGPVEAVSTAGVSYAAVDYVTCFSEVFQRDRQISRTSDRALSGWKPTRPLELVNLLGGDGTGDWAVKHGASASLPQAPKSTCRAWAAEIYEQLGARIDGLLVPSTVLGDPMVVLFTRSVSAFPIGPDFSRSLEHVAVTRMAIKASDRLGWALTV